MYNSVRVAENIRTLAKEQGIQVKYMLLRLGLNKDTLSSMNKGSMIKADRLALIADFLNCSVDFLLDRAGNSETFPRQPSESVPGVHAVSSSKASSPFSTEEIAHIKKYRLLDIYNRRLVDDVLDAAYNNMTKDINPKEHGVTYLNCYELPAAAGTGEPLGSTYYTDKVQVPLNRVPENAHICIRVHGDSMEPAYHDGDIVMVERFDGESVREGEIGIFVLNGEGYIKRLGDRELVSLNPAYDPIPIHDYDDLRCMGRVLGKV